MSELIDSIERRQLRKELPRFREGDRLRVHFQVVEGTRRRTQVFEGVVIRLQGAGSRRTFTVRKLSFGVGVERTFPLHSPKVERLELVARGEVRRAKLYYLRDRIGRRARVRERRDLGPEELASGVDVGTGAGEEDAAGELEPSADGVVEEQAPPDEPDEGQPVTAGAETEADAETERPEEGGPEEPDRAAEATAEAEQRPETEPLAETEEKD